MSSSRSSDQLKEQVKKELEYFFNLQPSKWTQVDTVRLHRWIKKDLGPYISLLRRGQIGQQSLKVE